MTTALFPLFFFRVTKFGMLTDVAHFDRKVGIYIAIAPKLFYERMLYAVRCLKSNEDMILALAGQFKQLSHEPEKFR